LELGSKKAEKPVRGIRHSDIDICKRTLPQSDFHSGINISRGIKPLWSKLPKGRKTTNKDNKLNPRGITPLWSKKKTILGNKPPMGITPLWWNLSPQWNKRGNNLSCKPPRSITPLWWNFSLEQKKAQPKRGKNPPCSAYKWSGKREGKVAIVLGASRLARRQYDR
jgi:hypothetical protein